MNILIFGKDGQLGKAFKALFANKTQEHHHIHSVGRMQCDLADPDALLILLNQSKPDLIINAAAYTAVDRAETEIDLAYAINAKAPEIMAQYAVEKGATLLHYSTDYVFDGSKDGVYTEDDSRNPLSVYGKSKAAGEQAIEKIFANRPAQSNAQYAIFRTSWVYGDGGNFIRTILRLAKEREELKIISDQYGVPTSSEWLAKVSVDLALTKDGQIRDGQTKDGQINCFSSGIYHAVPSGETTWHGLATLVVRTAIEAGIALKARPETIQAILAIEYPLPAPRPMNSRMASTKLRKVLANSRGDASSFYNQSETALHFPSWDGMVQKYVRTLAATKVI